MEIKFEQTPCRHLRRAVSQQQVREFTQEVRLTEAMPDIGRVLGCWGQVMLRGKEWRSGGMNVSGGVMAWVLYAPEDGSQIRSMEAWIPFQMKWEFPETERDGFICALPWLKSMDARGTSARKLMVRANVGCWGRALESVETDISVPGQVPEDVQMLRSMYPMELPRESGERIVSIEEELALPGSMPAAEQIMHYELTLQMQEQKVLSSRLVFRGKGRLHLLYWGDGKLNTWDCEVPFSQFADLDSEFDPQASAEVQPVLTDLELEQAEGKLRLKAGIAAQYIIFDRSMVELVEDAYSPVRTVELNCRELQLPARLDHTSYNAGVEQHIRSDAQRIVDSCFLPDQPQRRQNGDVAEMDIGGQVQVLYYDGTGTLQCASARLEQRLELRADADTMVDGVTAVLSQLQAVQDGEGIAVSAELQTDVTVLSGGVLSMVAGMEAGEAAAPDPGRPSLILQRCGGRLWDIAKSNGSTVEAIRRVNGLTEEAERGQMLLIPVS